MNLCIGLVKKLTISAVYFPTTVMTVCTNCLESQSELFLVYEIANGASSSSERLNQLLSACHWQVSVVWGLFGCNVEKCEGLVLPVGYIL